MANIKIVDGDIFVDRSHGVLEKVTGIEEGAQNVARHLLSEFSVFFQEGNQLLNYATTNRTSGLTEALANQFITEAINRLIVIQRIADVEDRVIKINQIRTRLIGLSTLVFMVEVMFESGEVASVTDQVSARPISMNHLVNPDAFLSV